MVYDMKRFYPSIKDNIFVKVTQFTKKLTEITDEGINLIMQARKTLLFNKGISQVKKKGKQDFDVLIISVTQRYVNQPVAIFYSN